MKEKEYLVIGGVVLVVLALLLYHPSTTPKTLSDLSRELNLSTGATNTISDCDVFSSLDQAHERYNIPGDWQICKNDSNRWIIFYDEGNLHAFLTCKLVGSKYYCCVMAKESYWFDYNEWKKRCT